ISRRIAQTVGMIDPHAGNLTTGELLQENTVNRFKNFRQLDPESGEAGDVKEAPEIEPLRSGAPVRGEIMLMIEQCPETIRGSHAPGAGIEIAQRTLERRANGFVRGDEIGQALFPLWEFFGPDGGKVGDEAGQGSI